MSQRSASRAGGKTHRTLRSPGELQAAAGHVRYELAMLVCAALYIPGGISSPAVGETKNIALEAFLLHYRNLRAFLCPSLQKTSGDDIIASDFMDNSIPEDVGDPGELGGDKDRIDKLLAHISYERARYEATGEKSWNPDAMARRIQKGMAKFFLRLSPERREWFRVRVEGEPPR